MNKAKNCDGISRQQLAANYKALEQDFRSYKWYRHLIACELGINANEELDDMLRAGGLPGIIDGAGENSSIRATAINDLYAVGAKDTKFIPLTPGHRPEYQKAHNLVRNVANPVMDDRGGRQRRSILGLVYLRRILDTTRAIFITLERLDLSEIREDQIRAEVARMYYMDRYKTQSGIALEFSSNKGHSRLGLYPMSQSTASRFCREVVEEVAACLGVMV